MSPWGMSPGLPRYLSVEVLHEHPSRGYTGHPSMAHSVLRNRNQVPGFRVHRGGNREQEAGEGVSLTLAKLKALAGAGQVLAGRVLSPLQAGQHD